MYTKTVNAERAVPALKRAPRSMNLLTPRIGIKHSVSGPSMKSMFRITAPTSIVIQSCGNSMPHTGTRPREATAARRRTKTIRNFSHATKTVRFHLILLQNAALIAFTISQSGRVFSPSIHLGARSTTQSDSDFLHRSRIHISTGILLPKRGCVVKVVIQGMSILVFAESKINM